MSSYLLYLTPFCIEEDVLGSWLGMMPVTFAAVYVGTTLKGLSEITHGWNEVSTTQWVTLSFVFGISVILLVLVTKIAVASMDNEQAKHAQINSTNYLTLEMLLRLEDKELYIPNPVKVRIDPLREDLERKMIVTVKLGGVGLEELSDRIKPSGSLNT